MAPRTAVGAGTHKRARLDGRWLAIPQSGRTDVMGDSETAIVACIADVRESSACGGLAPAALADTADCLLKAVRLGLGTEHTSALLWCLRPREGIRQHTMTALLAAARGAAFPPALRSQMLRWLLLMLEDEDGGQLLTPGGGATDSIASTCKLVLRPLYRVLFHMLIQACSAPAVGAVGGGPSEGGSAAADRSCLCQILLRVTTRREARPCWLQMALSLLNARPSHTGGVCVCVCVYVCVCVCVCVCDKGSACFWEMKTALFLGLQTLQT